MTMDQNITHIKNLIHQTELSCKRNAGSVLLLAVSKQQPVENIREAFKFGIHDFAENYFQEAISKMNELKNLPICWHFIGPIQSNKTKGIAVNFNWVHSINRYKTAELLNQFRPSNLAPLNVCLQINLIEEKTKSGVSPAEAEELIVLVNQLPQLKLRGLMTIPPPISSEKEQLETFMQLKHHLLSLNKKLNLNMDTLSMGMSDDFIPAIKAGATIVRIGRSIFGERQGKHNER